MSKYNRVIKNLNKGILELETYRANWMTAIDFETHIDKMRDHLEHFQEILLTGHFSTAFYERVKGLPEKYRCDFRVMAIDPRGNKDNLDTLRYLVKEGVKVKIHKKLHARMFIGWNETIDYYHLIIGSFDFNREGIGRDNINAGIWTSNPDVISKARQFFMEQWESNYTYELNGV